MNGSARGYAYEPARVVAEAVEPSVVEDLERTEEMPIVREVVTAAAAGTAGTPSARAASVPDVLESQTRAVARGGDGDEEGDSDVYLCRRKDDASQAAEAAVTLFVYGWESVEPGPLSWAFPSLRTALAAVRTMRNAVEWCIVAGSEWASVDAARAKGAVLVEQNS